MDPKVTSKHQGMLRKWFWTLLGKVIFGVDFEGFEANKVPKGGVFFKVGALFGCHSARLNPIELKMTWLCTGN
jgi:hypothetical protein